MAVAPELFGKWILKETLKEEGFFLKGCDGKASPLRYGRGEVVMWQRGNVA